MKTRYILFNPETNESKMTESDRVFERLVEEGFKFVGEIRGWNCVLIPIDRIDCYHMKPEVKHLIEKQQSGL